MSLDGRRVFVPSLKVGVLPKEEAGAVFYVDLPQQPTELDRLLRQQECRERRRFFA